MVFNGVLVIENGPQENGIPKRVLYMNLETRPRGRPRNRLQGEVREDGKIVGGKSILQRVMEEARENGKESSHSAHVNGMNECNGVSGVDVFQDWLKVGFQRSF
jgi:hypothetical protein